MNFDYIVYNVTVTPITPLHIGSGATLLRGYDFAVTQNNTWRINEDALLEAQDIESNPHLADTLARTPPDQLLKPQDFKPDSPFIRYRLAGKPRSAETGAQLQEQIKTVNDEVYLPGSSLKGAIRTALAWHGWAEKKITLTKEKTERNRKFAGRTVEKEIMGADPNHDLLRALHVSDSAPAGRDRVMVLNAQVVTPGSLGSPIELEAVQPDTPFHLTIKVDQALFSGWAKKHGFALGGNSAWLEQLCEVIGSHTRQRVKQELEWFKARRGAGQAAGLYQQLSQANLPANSCLLQLGWGTGWNGKTFGSHLLAHPDMMEHLISTYRLAMGQRQKGDNFPKSRRSTVQTVKDKSGKLQQRPGVPLGWVLMEMEPQS